MQLTQTGWEKPKSRFRDNFAQWSELTLKDYEKWCAENGLAVHHNIKQLLVPQTEATLTRGTGVSLRQFRRLLRKWRIKQSGSLSKKRAAEKAEKSKQKRWGVWIEQGIPLKDVEAIIWHIRANLVFRKRKTRYGTKPEYQSWLDEEEIRKVTGGFIPPGVDFEAEYRKIYHAKETIAGSRRQRAPYVFVQNKPKDKYMSEAHNAARESFNKAGFKHKFSFAYDIQIMLMRDTNNSIFTSPAMSMYDDPPSTYRRRGGRDTNVKINIRLDWYRKVYMTGLANAFGPRTFVLDVHPTADGQRTVVTLFRQPSEHRYKTETVTGYLGRDANGNPKFMEE